MVWLGPTAQPSTMGDVGVEDAHRLTLTLAGPISKPHKGVLTKGCINVPTEAKAVDYTIPLLNYNPTQRWACPECYAPVSSPRPSRKHEGRCQRCRPSRAHRVKWSEPAS